MEHEAIIKMITIKPATTLKTLFLENQDNGSKRGKKRKSGHETVHSQYLQLSKNNYMWENMEREYTNKGRYWVLSTLSSKFLVIYYSI